MGSKANTSGGLLIFRSIDLDESEEEVVARPGSVFWMRAHNRSAAEVFIKFYDATAADTTVGTTVPVMTIPVQPDSADTWEVCHGLAFSSAITVAATTGVADSDTVGPVANDVVVNIGYA